MPGKKNYVMMYPNSGDGIFVCDKNVYVTPYFITGWRYYGDSIYPSASYTANYGEVDGMDMVHVKRLMYQLAHDFGDTRPIVATRSRIGDVRYMVINPRTRELVRDSDGFLVFRRGYAKYLANCLYDELNFKLPIGIWQPEVVPAIVIEGADSFRVYSDPVKEL